MHPTNQFDLTGTFVNAAWTTLARDWVFLLPVGIILLALLVMKELTKNKRHRRHSGRRHQGRSDTSNRRGGAVRQRCLLSEWEASAMPAILAQCPPGMYVCPQVHVSDFLAEQGSAHFDWSDRFRGVANLIVDFLIVDRTGRPVLVIELDDKSHLLPDRMSRDRNLDQALAEAGVRILHVKPQTKINIASYLR